MKALYCSFALLPLVACEGVPTKTGEHSSSTPQAVAVNVNAANYSTNCANTAAIAQEAVEIINQMRALPRQCGTSVYNATTPISWNSNLATAAQQHSNDMVANDFFSHTGSNGLSVGNRVTNTGYNWQAVGENIAAGQDTLVAAIESWMSSPGHCANIMSPSFTEMGLACTTSSDVYGSYWTQVFAKPW